MLQYHSHQCQLNIELHVDKYTTNFPLHKMGKHLLIINNTLSSWICLILQLSFASCLHSLSMRPSYTPILEETSIHFIE